MQIDPLSFVLGAVFSICWTSFRMWLNSRIEKNVAKLETQIDDLADGHLEATYRDRSEYAIYAPSLRSAMAWMLKNAKPAEDGVDRRITVSDVFGVHGMFGGTATYTKIDEPCTTQNNPPSGKW